MSKNKGDMTAAEHLHRSVSNQMKTIYQAYGIKTDDASERKRFEAWLADQSGDWPDITFEKAGGRIGDDRYAAPTTAFAWAAWQAALASLNTVQQRAPSKSQAKRIAAQKGETP